MQEPHHHPVAIKHLLDFLRALSPCHAPCGFYGSTVMANHQEQQIKIAGVGRLPPHDAAAGRDLEPLPAASSSPPSARSQGTWVLGPSPLTSLDAQSCQQGQVSVLWGFPPGVWLRS